MSDLLSCRGITKKFQKKEALKGIDLDIEKGKIYGLVGRNGAGKTTLLAVMTAQSKATSGTVTLNGEKLWENQKAMNKLCFSRDRKSVV